MRYYIKATRRAAMMIFRRGNDADYRRADDINEHNKSVMARVFDGLMSGTMSAAYIRRGVFLDIYTKSLRGDFVQLSHFYTAPDGEIIATSHHDAHNALDMDERHGCYINILMS